MSNDPVLTDAQRAALPALLETIVPESDDGEMPSAAEVGFDAYLVTQGQVFAPMLQAVLDQLGAGFAIALDAASFGVSAALVATLRPTSQPRGGSSDSLLRGVREGWREFVAHRWLWTIVLQFSVLVMGFQATYAVIGPIVAGPQGAHILEIFIGKDATVPTPVDVEETRRLFEARGIEPLFDVDRPRSAE